MTATVVFFPEGAFGPTNNCVAIGQVLRQRGHRVVFVVEESFAGSLEAQGFEERLVRLGPPPAEPEEPGQFWKDFIRDTAPVFRKPTIEQIAEFIEPTFRALCDGARYVDERLREVFDELQPDVIVEDNVVAFPAISHSGKPWARITSCNPLEMQDPAIPPVFSGYPEADRTGWDAFRAEHRRSHSDLHAAFSAFCVDRGAGSLPEGAFMHESPWLNLSLYPAELDYARSIPLAPTWHRIESSVRRIDGGYELPDEVATGKGRLIYLSLGSLGSGDVDLMRHLVEVLSWSPDRFIVSKGPQAAEFELAPNMTGDEYLPQPAILPLVDLVIHHGGNNTTTECFHFGKPMIVLPLFWDQYDNAQRIHETGFGVRLRTYEFEDHELLDAIERLLGDSRLRDRMGAISARLQRSPGSVHAADLIEQLAITGCPVLSPGC
jgi:MGT family glycosyltransferase